MSAAEALKAARGAGIMVELDGDELSLSAASAPPAAVIELLAQNRSLVLALLRLRSTLCPPDLDPRRWPAVLDGALRFASEWADRAVALGWTLEELFKLRAPFRNVSLQGAAWLVIDKTVTAITEDAITMKTRHGSIQRFYRKGK